MVDARSFTTLQLQPSPLLLQLWAVGLLFPRSLSDLGVRREGKRDRDQNLCKFEANSGLFNEDLRKFWPISAFPQQNHPKSDRLLVNRLSIFYRQS
uniref:Uncharacterized protein n=1 Tax=Candidatus Kentrum sp. DK TaxID=2126562 RepID=A0A450RTR1_9GAMM|nr:MAG: hypothetical protein BECKDK2373C_GA0170839_1001113 [Candidatus Kentron sp. DK]